MKRRKLFKMINMSLISMLCFTSFIDTKNVSAYTSSYNMNKTHQGVNQIAWGENIYPLDKFKNIGTSIGVYNGSAVYSNESLTLRYSGNINPNANSLHTYGYINPLHLDGATYEEEAKDNKRNVDLTGIAIDDTKKYKISYDIAGDFERNHLGLFFCDENYIAFDNHPEATEGTRGNKILYYNYDNHVEFIFKPLSGSKYMNLNFDFIFTNPVGGESVTLSNLKIQELKN